MNNRCKHIDIAKGIGIILVVLGHSVPHNTYLGMVIYSFHMPLFFLLSGVFAKTSEKEKLFPFLKKNIKQLIVPYIVFIIIGILVNLSVPQWREAVNVENIKSALIYCNPYFWKSTSALWFLIALFEVRIVFYLYHKLILSKNNILVNILSLFVLFIVGCYIKSIEFHFGLFLPFMFKSSVMSTAFYSLGYLLKNEFKNTDLFKKKIGIFMTLGCVLVTIISPKLNGEVNLGSCNYNNVVLFVFFAFSGIIATLGISSFLENKTDKILLFAGKESMTIYLVHQLVKAYIILFIEKALHIVWDEALFCQRLAVFLFTLCLSVLLAYFYSKIKNRKKDNYRC